MVGLSPLSLVLYDAVVAGGLGALLAVFYHVMHLLIGKGKIGMFCCDAITIFCAGVLYRSACVSVFATSVMRWYTFLSLAIGYWASHCVLHALFHRAEEQMHHILFELPCKYIRQHCIAPVLRCIAVAKQKKQHKRAKIKKQHLQKQQKVLYNSK